MKIFDLPILDLVEEFAQLVERLTGIPPLKIALVGEIIAGVSAISVWMVPDIPFALKILNTMTFGVVVLSTIFKYPQVEKIIKEDSANKLSNRFKVMPFYIFARVALTVLVLNSLANIWDDGLTLSFLVRTIMIVGVWVLFYFMCCDPLPPGTESKLKKFLASHRIYWKRAKI